MLNPDDIERMQTQSDPHPELTLAIQACARLVLGATLSLLQNDPHQWSERPCGTCHSVSILVGKLFGCDLYRAQRQNQRKREEAQKEQS